MCVNIALFQFPVPKMLSKVKMTKSQNKATLQTQRHTYIVTKISIAAHYK